MRHFIILVFFFNSFSVFSKDSYQKYVVQLMCTNRGERLASYGTGTFVRIDNLNYILTCYHVIVGYDNIDVQYAENTDVHKAKLLYFDLNKDIALLGFDTHQTVYTLPLDNGLSNDIYRNPAIVVGFPNGMDCNRFNVNFTHVDGYTSKTNIKNNNGNHIFDNSVPDFDVITCTTDARGGISGAPIIANGRITGIISGSLENGYSFAWAVPIKYCHISSLTAASGRSQKNLPQLKGYLFPLNSRHGLIEADNLSFYETQLPKITGFADSYDQGVDNINKTNEFAQNTLSLIQKNKGEFTTPLVNDIETSISINQTNYNKEPQDITIIQENISNLIISYEQLRKDNQVKLGALPIERFNEVEQLFKPALLHISKIKDQEEFDKKLESLKTSIIEYKANDVSSNEIKYGTYYVKYLNSLIDFNQTLLTYYNSIYNAVFIYKRAMDYAFNLINVKEV